MGVVTVGLPWVRVDTHIGTHDKFLSLLSDPSPKRWQAAFSYVCALGWSGDQGTDGHVPKVALSFVHGNNTTARLLTSYRLWSDNCDGWNIVNYAERQQLAAVTAAKQEALRQAARKANCVRHHGPNDWVEGKGCYRLDGPFD